MSWQEKYQEWLNDPQLDMGLKAELTTVSDEADLADRFYQYLEFGTGGMRGEIGAGTNRINMYTIKRVSLGLARYINENGIEAAKQGVVISYDNRQFSNEFAQWTARILASQGIKVYLSDELRPTPELSFLVRKFNAFSGVMITASHNPKQYNGFKVYGADGGQITLDTANRLMTLLGEIKDELQIDADRLEDYQKQGLVKVFSSEVDELYLEQLTAVIQDPQMVKEFGGQLNVVYTPLHGTGKVLIEKAFQRFGLSNLTVVSEQAMPDPAFSTVKSPNPEDPAAFTIALEKAKTENAQLVLATDPDADRLGVVVFDNKEPIFLNGNQIGVLLLDYLIKKKAENQVDLSQLFLAKTIVTSELGSKIATAHQIETRNTLTGFKFIGEQIELSEEKNDKHFLFGYEESYGYLIKPFVRDKDAIQAATLLTEVALDCHLQGETLANRLQAIYKEYGYFKETLETKEFKGQNGINEMNALLERLRKNPLASFGGEELVSQEDYLTSVKTAVKTDVEKKIVLPKSNVLKWIFSDNSWVCVRPSGTEPKFKIYYSVNGESESSVTEKMERLQKAFHQLIQE